MLNDKDLSLLTFEVKRSRWGYKSFLYLKKDCELLMKKKFGGTKGVEEEALKRSKRKEKLVLKKKEQMNNRKLMIDEALKAIGIDKPPKHEIDLYNKYINGFIKDPLEDIVLKLKRQSELEKKTAFNDLYEKRQDVLQQIRERLFREYHGWFQREKVENLAEEEYKEYIAKMAIEFSSLPELDNSNELGTSSSGTNELGSSGTNELDSSNASSSGSTSSSGTNELDSSGASTNSMTTKEVN